MPFPDNDDNLKQQNPWESKGESSYYSITIDVSDFV